jgi:thiol-disulfide isomerase/thioredoxin
MWNRHRQRDTLDLPVEGDLASFAGATGWLNSGPLTPADLRGQVVVVEFLTYTCINWLRTLPYVRAWYEKYKDHGLTVIGVHSPEFSFESDVDNVVRSLKEEKVDYPIAIDSNYGVWRSFDNHFWPALYFADAEGRIRHHRFGEGDYEGSEMIIQMLLAAAGQHDVSQMLVSVNPTGFEVGADWGSLRSGENYVGYGRTEDFASPDGVVADRPHTYAHPSGLRLNQWGLSGDWTMEQEAARSNAPGGRIVNRFHARDLHFVLGPARDATSVRFRVSLDGEAPGDAHGADIDEQGNGVLHDQRLHQLIRQPGPITERTFEIEFLDAGAEAFCFTFG